ncbi:MAG: ABC transporter substrate-binding protein [Acidimicrobiia bacterium]
MKGLKARYLALIGVFALVVAACGQTAEPAETTAEAPAAAPTTAAPAPTPAPTEGAEETVLIIGTTDAISSLDGSDAYAVHDWELLKNVGEGLLIWEPGTGDKLMPGAAEDFGTFSDDGLSYTIKLKEGLVFGDGTPLTAQAYADQINTRLLVLEGSGGVGPALGQPYVESVEALDDLTIKFNLTDTWGFFEQLLAGAPYIPLNPTQFPTGAGAELVEFPDPPIYGNGPYYIESYTIGEQTVLKANPLYQGVRTPNVDTVIIRYFGSPQAMAEAVQSGEIDVAWRILGPELLDQVEAAGLNVQTISGGAIRYLIVNHAEGFPGADPNVAKALATLIDRDDLSDRVFGGRVEPLYSQVPPGFLGATEVFDTMYGAPDVDAALALLAAAGYTPDSPLQLELWYPPEHYGGTVADAMQVLEEQLETGGAIEVELKAQEWSTYVGAVIGGADYPVSLLGWFYDYPDPDNYISPFVQNGGLGTMVTDPDTGAGINAKAQELVDKLAQAASSGDQAEREALYREIQEIYADLVVTIPLWFEAEHVVYRDGISGDTAFGEADKLNIGPTIEFNYATVNKG